MGPDLSELRSGSKAGCQAHENHFLGNCWDQHAPTLTCPSRGTLGYPPPISLNRLSILSFPALKNTFLKTSHPQPSTRSSRLSISSLPPRPPLPPASLNTLSPRPVPLTSSVLSVPAHHHNKDRHRVGHSLPAHQISPVGSKTRATTFCSDCSSVSSRRNDACATRCPNITIWTALRSTIALHRRLWIGIYAWLIRVLH